jgi:hypothetical protein
VTQPSPDQLAQLARERSLELAERDLHAIATLLDSDGWQYLSRRLHEQRQALRDRLADDDSLDDLSTRTLRAIVKEYGTILALPLSDRAIHTATLASASTQDHGPRRG